MGDFDGSANSPADNPANAGGDTPKTYTADEIRGGGWRELITDESLRTHSSTANIKSLDDFAKSFIHSQALVGKKGLIIPSSDDTEGWNGVYKALGRPDTSDDYGLQLPEGSPEQWKGDGFKEYKQNFQQQMFDAGLNTKQAQAVWNHVQNVALEGVNKKTASTNKLMADQVETLKQTYGATLDSAMAKRDAVINKFAGKDGVDYIRNNPELNTSPTLMKLFNEMAKSFSEDTITDNTLNPGGQMTPSEARAKLNAIIGDKSHAFNNPHSPGHRDAVEDYLKIRNMVGGS